jgi:hypothetical protein
MSEINEQSLFHLPETQPAEPVDTAEYAAAAAAAADNRTIDYDKREASEEAIAQGHGPKKSLGLESENNATDPNVPANNGRKRTSGELSSREKMANERSEIQAHLGRVIKQVIDPRYL